MSGAITKKEICYLGRIKSFDFSINTFSKSGKERSINSFRML
jgi:small nuclear ribonucleoprotein (snRNP)-like protein